MEDRIMPVLNLIGMEPEEPAVAEPSESAHY
jgi:hypothetical protein